MILTKLLLTALGKVARGILFGLVSERLTVKLVFWLVKQVTDRTSNRWDDQVLVFLKEAYKEGTGKAVETLEDAEGAMPRPQAESPTERDSVALGAINDNMEELRHG